MATKQVHPMDFTGNISENWARWKELMELVLAGPSANKWTETLKATSSSSALANKAETWPEPGCQAVNFPKTKKKYFRVVCHLRNTLRAKKECDHSEKAFL